MATLSDAKQRKKDKKLNRKSVGSIGAADMVTGDADEAGPSGRSWTLSIAVPGSHLDHLAISSGTVPGVMEAVGYLAAQIARAAVNFQVDEVVVYDPSPSPASASSSAPTVSAGTALLAQLLQFLETPPHLRPNLLHSSHPGFRLPMLLPQLSAPHHLRGGLGGRAAAGSQEWVPYREGVVLKSEPGSGSYVDVGLDRMVCVEQQLPPKTRVTVHLGDSGAETTRFMAAYSETMICGQLVPPSLPRERLGLYWGYSVRAAVGLPRTLKECGVGKAYDLTICSSPAGAATDPTSLQLPAFRHALLLFGCPEADVEALLQKDLDWRDKLPQDVFNLYLNTSPHMGGLRLRTEDAVPIALSYLITPLLKHGQRQQAQ